MVNYFALIPAAAARREVDGNLYAYVGHCVTKDGIRDCKPKMMRVASIHPSNGTARVYLGCMGDAIAQTVNLPFSVISETAH